MKFFYKQNHTVVQTMTNKQTGAVLGRYAVCKFDENGELETNDPKIIHILQNKLPDCTWEGEQEVKVEDIAGIFDDDEIRKLAKEKKIKSWHVKSPETLRKELGV